MVLYIELDKETERRVRERAMRRFDYTKGALKEAVGEAVNLWLASTANGIEPLPVSSLRGVLKDIRATSVDLKHAAAGLFAR